MSEPETSTTEETAEGFTPEELATYKISEKEGSETSAKEELKPEDEDTWDPTDEEFEVALPKKEEEEEPEEKKSEEKKEAPKEEKKAEGAETAHPDQTKKSAKAESSKEEVEKKEERPEAPSTVKLKIGDKEYDIPKDAYDEVQATIEKANRFIDNHKTLVGNLVEKHSETYLDLLTQKHNGDRDKAYGEMIQEYAKVLKAELDYQALPEEQRRALDAENEAKRAKEELERYKAKEAEEREQKERAERINSMFKDITEAMNGLGIPTVTDEFKPIAMASAREIEAQLAEDKKPDVKAVVRAFKERYDLELAERDKRYQESLEKLPDEEFLQRHGKLIDRARKIDLAKLEKERATPAKTSRKPTPRDEQEGATRSKSKVMSSEEWRKYFGT